MFEKAARLKLRFKVSNGIVNTEDLWDLNLHMLDNLARALNKEIQDKEISFIGKSSKEDSALQLKFEIAKHVIEVKLAEQEAAKSAVERLQRRKEILEVLADKQSEDLRNKSREDLLKELAELE